MKEQTKGTTFEQVEKIASEMLTQGVKPTVRGVISVSGGKTEVVSKHLRDFFEKRDTEVSKMADEIGSSSVAKLIASEIQLIVDKRTAQLFEVTIRQKEQINELVELLEQKAQQIEKIIIDSKEAIDTTNRETSEKIEKITLDAQNKINKAEEKVSIAIEAQKQTETEISEIKLISQNTVQASKEQAQALVDAANKRAEQAEQEAKLLREQVKSLSIDEATRNIEKAEFEKNQQLLDSLRLEYAEQKTEIVRFTAENKALLKDTIRLESENKEYKLLDKELAKFQTQVVESQKIITELSNKLSLSERERESLTIALSQQTKSIRE